MADKFEFTRQVFFTVYSFHLQLGHKVGKGVHRTIIQSYLDQALVIEAKLNHSLSLLTSHFMWSYFVIVEHCGF